LLSTRPDKEADAVVKRINRRGQFILIFALAIVALVGAMALTTDVAVIYFKYTSLQTATDLSALAGAAYLPSQATKASQTAQSFALSNGIAASEITGITVAPGGANIRVSTTRQVPAFFAKVLGKGSFTVTATAVAAPVPVSTNVWGTLPVGLDSRTTYVSGQAITLHQGQKLYGPGNWGGLALGGTGASVYQSNLTDGYNGALNVGDSIPTEPGATTGPTRKGIDDRIAAGLAFDPSGTAANHGLNDPRAVTVPLVDWAGAAGRSDVNVVGFCEIWLDGVTGTDIKSTFIAQSVRGQGGGSPPYAGALHTTLIS
jgi:Flp pilus assembly protein TadG